MKCRRIASEPFFPYILLLTVLGQLNFHFIFTRVWDAEMDLNLPFFLTVLTPCGNITTEKWLGCMLYVFFCFPVQSVNPFPVFCTSHFLGKSWFMSCHSIVVEHSCFYLMLLWQLEVWFSLYCTRRGYKTLKAVYINISYQFKNCFFSIVPKKTYELVGQNTCCAFAKTLY